MDKTLNIYQKLHQVQAHALLIQINPRLLAAVGFSTGHVTIFIVAIRAGGGDHVCRLDDAVLVFGFGCLVCLHPRVAQALNELRPIRIVHGHGEPIGAFAAGNRQQIRGLG